jgi:hypothetical protein
MGGGGDDGPGIGGLIVPLRIGVGEAREDPLDEGRPSLGGVTGVGFCLRKKRPAVVLGLLSNELSGLWYCSGGQGGLPEIARGITTGGGVVVL